MSRFITLPSSNQSLSEFRSLCRTATERDQPVVRNITAAGAMLENNGLSFRDRHWLHHTLALCNDQNIAVDPDFRVTPVNYNNGHDILDPKLALPPTDLLVVCFIINRSTVAGNKEHRRGHQAGYSVSPRCQPTAWTETVQRLNPLVVVTFFALPFRQIEVCSRSFPRPDGYTTVGPQPVMAPTATTSGPLKPFGRDALIRQAVKVTGQKPAP